MNGENRMSESQKIDLARPVFLVTRVASPSNHLTIIHLLPVLETRMS
jgi:hypothetical protein